MLLLSTNLINVMLLIFTAPIKQSAAFVFTTFTDGTGGGVDGFGWSTRASPVYVAVTGILLAQYTITGYDASAHLAEETQDAARNAPKGILMAVGVRRYSPQLVNASLR